MATHSHNAARSEKRMSTYSVDLACHPHRLTLWEGTKETFRCSLCRCHGYGSFYRCSNSDCSAYQIHDSCAHAPDSLSFVGHAQHPLALLPEIKGGSGYCCDLCTYCITGVYYGCHACAFFVHPVCARLPPSTVSPVHPQHLVTLIPGKGYNYSWDCSSCSRRCGGWHYACAPCRVRLHPWCLLGNGNNYENFPLCICRT